MEARIRFDELTEVTDERLRKYYKYAFRCPVCGTQMGVNDPESDEELLLCMRCRTDIEIVF